MYVREAHPGEKLPHHTGLAQKLEHARLFQERWSIRRPILVDDLDGPMHRAYGSLPNMTYILTPPGRVAFRADWTDARTIEWVLDYLMHEAGEKRTHRRVAPFAELLGHRSAADYPRAVLEGMLNGGGRRAVEEYIAAVERKRSSAEAELLRRTWAKIQAQIRME